MTDDEELAALREQTSHGDRIDEAATVTETQTLVSDIVTELEALEAGERQKTISVWDGQLAALLRALEENPDQLTTVGHALQRQLDLEESDVDRSTVLRLALRRGFQEAAPETVAALRDAVQQQATKEL